MNSRLHYHLNTIEFTWTKNIVSQRSPITLEIHPTNRCNLNCVFCSYNHVRANEILSIGTFERLIKSLIDCVPVLKAVIFSGGGEPSIHPYLPTAIQDLVNAGIEVGIISNGTYLSEELLRAYLKCRVIRFSLDVPLEKTYQNLISQWKPQNFKKVLSNTKRLSTARKLTNQKFPRIGLGYLITRDCQNDDALLNCLNIAAEVGADFVDYRPLIGYNEEQVTRPLSDFEKIASAVEEHARELGVEQQFRNFLRIFNNYAQQIVYTEHKSCPVVQDGLIGLVAATGDVVPCCAIYRSLPTRDWSYGNINEIDFLDIWKGPLREKVIRKIDARNCPFCRYQRYNDLLNSYDVDQYHNANNANVERDSMWMFL